MDVLWPCHALLGSPSCLRKYLAVLKLLTKYIFADPYANNTRTYYIKLEINEIMCKNYSRFYHDLSLIRYFKTRTHITADYI